MSVAPETSRRRIFQEPTAAVFVRMGEGVRACVRGALKSSVSPDHHRGRGAKERRGGRLEVNPGGCVSAVRAA